MTVNDLMPFCCSDSTRPVITHPWTAEGYTQATNGRILIRVAPIEDVEINTTTAPVTDRLFPKQEPTEWHDITELQLMPGETCPHCNKAESVVCPECGGNGQVELSNHYNSYVVDCKTCEGSGETYCRHCEGRGFLEGVTQLGSAQYSSDLLRQLQSLPNCKVGIGKPLEPAWFRFDGGDGLVMPVR